MRGPKAGPVPSLAGQQTKGNAMTQIEIANLEHAGRSAMAWVPEGYDGKTHYDALLGAMVPAVAILAAAAALLFAIL